MFEYSVLGPLEVAGPVGPAPITGRHERTVLAALVAWEGDVVSRERLVAALWGDHPPRSSTKVVQNLVMRLRKVLGSTVIATRPGGYTLRVASDSIDLRRFERLVAEGRAAARAGQWEASASALTAALGMWRGPPLVELDGWPPGQWEAARLEELRAGAVEDHADALLATRPASELVAELDAAAGAEPYRERRQGQLMVALARSGRPVEAMRSYERFRRRLADEVGMVPSRSLQRLNDDVLRQAPGTEWDYSAPETPGPSVGPDRLPRPMTSFVGRGDEVDALVTACVARELVTVCGPAGVGKTRVAVEAARAFASARAPRDGVWWCDLSAVSLDRDGHGHDVVAISVAAALGASPEAGLAVRDTVLGFVADKDLTLVIDNCEQVVGPLAALVSEIRRRAPCVGVLTTSREPLAIGGERVLDLGPLGDEDAARLFVERAAAVRAHFAVDAEAASLVAEVCRRLDGLPLAVELAAGRVASLGVADLAGLLDDRFRVLVTTRRDAPDRHRTLRGAIDRSYDALSADEQAVFARLAVFPESFGLDAAEAVCHEGALGPGDVLELLSHLVARSLLVAQPDERGAVRYRLLETLRAYANEQLALRGDEATRVHRRHAEHFAGLVAKAATRIGGPDEPLWLTWLATEIPNLRAAVHWATAEGDLDLATSLFTSLPVWTWCGTARTAEIGRWADLLARQPGVEDHSAYRAVCDWGCRGVFASGDEASFLAWMGRVTAPGFEPTPWILGFLAHVTMPENPREANAMLRRGAEMAGAAGDRFLEATLRFTINNSSHQPSLSLPSPEAVENARLALAAARACGSPNAIAWGLLGFAMIMPSIDREATLAAIDELPGVVARCAFPNPTLVRGAEHAMACMRVSEGDLSGLELVRAQISAQPTFLDRRMLSIHLVDLAEMLVYLGVAPDTAAELIAGVRAQRLQFRASADVSADVLRDRMGDGPYEAAVRRGAGMTLEQLAHRAVTTIDELLSVDLTA